MAIRTVWVPKPTFNTNTHGPDIRLIVNDAIVKLPRPGVEK